MNETLERWYQDNSDTLARLSRTIWEHPEASEQEHFACQTLKDYLTEEGFTISPELPGGLDTAFEAKWGSGRPYIGFLAEYDALPGLGQEAVDHPAPLDQPFGHGCGHNLLGTAAVGAAIALARTMAAEQLPGTVYLYGCPSEEVMIGKVVMAKAHVFDHLDAAISWHPGDKNRPSEESYQAMLSMEYHFKGKASHAAMAPQEGFSALDAVELMDVGVNYLREHVPPGGQMHYVILNGGDKPNIVPDKAAVWQFLRANSTADLRKMAKRLDDIADGAAKMTGTTYEKKILTGCNETRIVPALVEIMQEVMDYEVPAPAWTEEEQDFARSVLTHLGQPIPDHPLHGGVLKTTGHTIDILGSSDISEVSYIVPTCMVFTACYPIGTPNHSWAVTACVGSSIGVKGMLYASEIMASTGYRLVKFPDQLDEVQDSFKTALNGAVYTPVDQ